MELLVLGLGPVVVSGYAVQQMLELLDPVLGRLGQPKRVWYGAIALLLGLLLALLAGLRIFVPLGVTTAPPWLDSLVTGLVISAASDGFNSVNKYLAYMKAKEKREARLQ
jgi:hypothetical protein